ncbi:carboxy terminal-processing peptidase [Orbaceae bacterium ac157xtp]
MKKTMYGLLKKYQLAIILIFLGVFSAQAAQTKSYSVDELPNLKPDPIHEVVARRVTNYFTQSHYRDFNLDGVFSAKIFDRYLQQLDGNKAVLIKSDIDKFRESQNLLGEQLRAGNVDIAFAMYNVAQKRRFERYQYALTLLEQPFDFTIDETADFDRKDLAWATTQAELDTYWQQRVKYDALSLALTGKTDAEIKETLAKRYNRILRTLTQTQAEDAFQVFMNAFAREIDPHTSYLAPRSKRDFDTDMSLSFEGIGATLNQEDDYTKIHSFITGGPAEHSKQLAIGDRIIGVGQKNKPIEDVIGWRLDDIVEKIRGPKGTIVRLEILPAGNNSKPKIVEIMRDKIHFEDREAKLSIIENERGKVAVIDIPSFYIGLTEKVTKLLNEVKDEDVKGIVIDLRNNGGGSLAEVISLTGLFIENGPVVQVRDNMQKIAVYDDHDETVYFDGPIVVMVNRYSASASEIFSAAMQDYGRAVIVGETTFGKGTVQTSRNIAYPMDSKIHPDWPQLGGVQYTIQKFYRINGGSTQLKGVTPDVDMIPTSYIDETGERYLDNALPWDKIAPASYEKLIELKTLLPELKKLHSERIKLNPEFAYIEEDVAEYNSKKDHIYEVSLNKAKREAEQKASDEKELKRINERLSRAGLPLITKLEDQPKEYKIPDAYLDEAVEILLDFATYYPIVVNVKPKQNMKIFNLSMPIQSK